MAEHKKAEVYPLVNFSKTYMVYLPGVKKENIEVKVEDQDLYITWGTAAVQHYSLPDDVDIDLMSARFENDTLTVRLHPSKTRTIPVE